MATTTVTQNIVGGVGKDMNVWTRFNSAGTIADSYNVSSITDNGTGDFTVNFSLAIAPSGGVFGVGLGTWGGTGSADEFTSQLSTDSNSGSNMRVVVWSRGFDVLRDPTFVMYSALY